MALRGIRKIRGTSYLRTRNYGLPNKVADTKAIITDVVDGDTVTVSYTDGRTENIKIRLENINAPEITNEVTNKKSEYLGNYAKQVLSTKLVGKTVTVTGADDNYDVYGRKVAYIYDYIDTTDRTKSLNYQMVESGLARYYPFAGSYDPKILEAEMKAIASNQGVWNDPVYKYVKEELYSDLGPTIDFHTTAWRAASDKIPQIVASYYSGETSSGKTNLSADFYSTEQYQWMIKEEDRAQRAAAIYTYAPDIVEKYTSARETETPHRIEELSPADRAELNLAKAQELWRYSSIRLAGVVPSVVAGGDPSFGPGFGQPLSYTAPGWIFINMPFFGWGWSEDPEVKRAVDINILGYRLRYDTLFGSAADPEGSRALLYAPFGRTTGAFVDLFRSGDVGRFANEFLFQGSNIFSEQPQGQMVLTNMNPEGVFSSNSSVLQRNAQIYKQEMIPTPGRVEEATRPVTFGERELFVRAAKASPDWNYETGKWKNKYTEAQIYNMESLELRKWARDRLTFTLEPTWENYFKGTLAEKSVYWDYPSLDEAMYGDLQYRMPMYPQGGIDQSFEGSQIVETPAGLKNALAATMLYDLAIVPYWTANISSSLISGGARAMMGGLGAVTAKETLTGIKQGAQTLLLESAKTGLKAAAGGAGFGAAMGLAFGGGAEGGIFGAAFGAGLGFLGGFFNSAVLGFIAPIAVTGSVLADLISSTTTKKYSIGIEDNQFNAFSTPVGRTLYPYSTSDGIAESWLQDYTNNVITNWWDSPNRRAFGNNRPDEPEYGVLDVDQFNKAATGFSSFLGSFARLQGRRQITDLVSPLFTSMAEGIDDTNLAKATFKELQEKGELSSPAMPFPVLNPWESINAEAWQMIETGVLYQGAMELAGLGFNQGAKLLVRKPALEVPYVPNQDNVNSIVSISVSWRDALDKIKQFEQNEARLRGVKYRPTYLQNIETMMSNVEGIVNNTEFRKNWQKWFKDLTLMSEPSAGVNYVNDIIKMETYYVHSPFETDNPILQGKITAYYEAEQKIDMFLGKEVMVATPAVIGKRLETNRIDVSNSELDKSAIEIENIVSLIAKKLKDVSEWRKSTEFAEYSGAYFKTHNISGIDFDGNIAELKILQDRYNLTISRLKQKQKEILSASLGEVDKKTGISSSKGAVIEAAATAESLVLSGELSDLRMEINRIVLANESLMMNISVAKQRPNLTPSRGIKDLVGSQATTMEWYIPTSATDSYLSSSLVEAAVLPSSVVDELGFSMRKWRTVDEARTETLNYVAEKNKERIKMKASMEKAGKIYIGPEPYTQQQTNSLVAQNTSLIQEIKGMAPILQDYYYTAADEIEKWLVQEFAKHTLSRKSITDKINELSNGNYEFARTLSQNSAVSSAMRRFEYSEAQYIDLKNIAEAMNEIDRQQFLSTGEFLGSLVNKVTTVNERLVMKSSIDLVFGGTPKAVQESWEIYFYLLERYDELKNAPGATESIEKLRIARSEADLRFISTYGFKIQELMEARGFTTTKFGMTDEMSLSNKKFTMDDFRNMIPDVVKFYEDSDHAVGAFVRLIGDTNEQIRLLADVNDPRNQKLSPTLISLSNNLGELTPETVAQVLYKVTQRIETEQISLYERSILNKYDIDRRLRESGVPSQEIKNIRELSPLTIETMKGEYDAISESDIRAMVKRELREPTVAAGAGWSKNATIPTVTPAQLELIQNYAVVIWKERLAKIDQTNYYINKGIIAVESGFDSGAAAKGITSATEIKKVKEQMAAGAKIDLISASYPAAQENLVLGKVIHDSIDQLLTRPAEERSIEKLHDIFRWRFSQDSDLQLLTDAGANNGGITLARKDEIFRQAWSILASSYESLPQDGKQVLYNGKYYDVSLQTEVKFDTKIGDTNVTGFVDLVVEYRDTKTGELKFYNIKDWKIGGVDIDLPKETIKDMNLQLQIYAEAMKAKYGMLPRDATYVKLGIGVNGEFVPTKIDITVDLSTVALGEAIRVVDEVGNVIETARRTLRGIEAPKGTEVGKTYRLVMDRDPVSGQKLEYPIYGQVYNTKEEALRAGIPFSTADITRMKKTFSDILIGNKGYIDEKTGISYKYFTKNIQPTLFDPTAIAGFEAAAEEIFAVSGGLYTSMPYSEKTKLIFPSDEAAILNLVQTYKVPTTLVSMIEQNKTTGKWILKTFDAVRGDELPPNAVSDTSRIKYNTLEEAKIAAQQQGWYIKSFESPGQALVNHSLLSSEIRSMAESLGLTVNLERLETNIPGEEELVLYVANQAGGSKEIFKKTYKTVSDDNVIDFMKNIVLGGDGITSAQGLSALSKIPSANLEAVKRLEESGFLTRVSIPGGERLELRIPKNIDTQQKKLVEVYKESDLIYKEIETAEERVASLKAQRELKVQEYDDKLKRHQEIVNEKVRIVEQAKSKLKSAKLDADIDAKYKQVIKEEKEAGGRLEELRIEVEDIDRGISNYNISIRTLRDGKSSDFLRELIRKNELSPEQEAAAKLKYVEAEQVAEDAARDKYKKLSAERKEGDPQLKEARIKYNEATDNLTDKEYEYDVLRKYERGIKIEFGPDVNEILKSKYLAPAQKVEDTAFFEYEALYEALGKENPQVEAARLKYVEATHKTSEKEYEYDALKEVVGIGKIRISKTMLRYDEAINETLRSNNILAETDLGRKRSVYADIIGKPIPLTPQEEAAKIKYAEAEQKIEDAAYAEVDRLFIELKTAQAPEAKLKYVETEQAAEDAAFAEWEALYEVFGKENPQVEEARLKYGEAAKKRMNKDFEYDSIIDQKNAQAKKARLEYVEATHKTSNKEREYIDSIGSELAIARSKYWDTVMSGTETEIGEALSAYEKIYKARGGIVGTGTEFIEYETARLKYIESQSKYLESEKALQEVRNKLEAPYVEEIKVIEEKKNKYIAEISALEKELAGIQARLIDKPLTGDERLKVEQKIKDAELELNYVTMDLTIAKEKLSSFIQGEDPETLNLKKRIEFTEAFLNAKKQEDIVYKKTIQEAEAFLKKIENPEISAIYSGSDVANILDFINKIAALPEGDAWLVKVLGEGYGNPATIVEKFSKAIELIQREDAIKTGADKKILDLIEKVGDKWVVKKYATDPDLASKVPEPTYDPDKPGISESEIIESNLSIQDEAYSFDVSSTKTFDTFEEAYAAAVADGFVFVNPAISVHPGIIVKSANGVPVFVDKTTIEQKAALLGLGDWLKTIGFLQETHNGTKVTLELHTNIEGVRKPVLSKIYDINDSDIIADFVRNIAQDKRGANWIQSIITNEKKIDYRYDSIKSMDVFRDISERLLKTSDVVVDQITQYEYTFYVGDISAVNVEKSLTGLPESVDGFTEVRTQFVKKLDSYGKWIYAIDRMTGLTKTKESVDLTQIASGEYPKKWFDSEEELVQYFADLIASDMFKEQYPLANTELLLADSAKKTFFDYTRVMLPKMFDEARRLGINCSELEWKFRAGREITEAEFAIIAKDLVDSPLFQLIGKDVATVTVGYKNMELYFSNLAQEIIDSNKTFKDFLSSFVGIKEITRVSDYTEVIAGKTYAYKDNSGNFIKIKDVKFDGIYKNVSSTIEIVREAGYIDVLDLDTQIRGENLGNEIIPTREEYIQGYIDSGIRLTELDLFNGIRGVKGDYSEPSKVPFARGKTLVTGTWNLQKKELPIDWRIFESYQDTIKNYFVEDPITGVRMAYEVEAISFTDTVELKTLMNNMDIYKKNYENLANLFMNRDVNSTPNETKNLYDKVIAAQIEYKDAKILYEQRRHGMLTQPTPTGKFLTISEVKAKEGQLTGVTDKGIKWNLVDVTSGAGQLKLEDFWKIVGPEQIDISKSLPKPTSMVFELNAGGYMKLDDYLNSPLTNAELLKLGKWVDINTNGISGAEAQRFNEFFYLITPKPESAYEANTRLLKAKFDEIRRTNLAISFMTKTLLGEVVPGPYIATADMSAVPYTVPGKAITMIPVGTRLSLSFVEEYAGRFAMFQMVQSASLGPLNPAAFLGILNSKNPMFAGSGPILQRFRAALLPLVSDKSRGIKAGYLTEGLAFIVFPEWMIARYGYNYAKNLLVKPVVTFSNSLKDTAGESIPFAQRVSIAFGEALRGKAGKEWRRNLTNIFYDTQFAYRIAIAAYGKNYKWINEASSVFFESLVVKGIATLRPEPSAGQMDAMKVADLPYRTLMGQMEDLKLFEFDVDKKQDFVSHLIKAWTAEMNVIDLQFNNPIELYNEKNAVVEETIEEYNIKLAKWKAAKIALAYQDQQTLTSTTATNDNLGLGPGWNINLDKPPVFGSQYTSASLHIVLPINENQKAALSGEDLAEVSRLKIEHEENWFSAFTLLMEELNGINIYMQYKPASLQDTLTTEWQKFFPDLDIFEPNSWRSGLSSLTGYMDSLVGKTSEKAISTDVDEELEAIEEDISVMIGYYAGTSSKSDFTAALADINNRIGALKSKGFELPLQVTSDIAQAIEAENYFNDKITSPPEEIANDTSSKKWASKAYQDAYKDSPSTAASINQTRMKQLISMNQRLKAITSNRMITRFRESQQRIMPSAAIASIAQTKSEIAAAKNPGRMDNAWSPEMVETWREQLKTLNTASDVVKKEIVGFLDDIGTGKREDTSATISVESNGKIYMMNPSEYNVYNKLISSFYDMQVQMAKLLKNSPFSNVPWSYKALPLSQASKDLLATLPKIDYSTYTTGSILGISSNNIETTQSIASDKKTALTAIQKLNAIPTETKNVYSPQLIEKSSDIVPTTTKSAISQIIPEIIKQSVKSNSNFAKYYKKETPDMRSVNYTGGEDWSKYKTQQETPDMRSMNYTGGEDWSKYKTQQETPDMRSMSFGEGIDWGIYKEQKETQDMRSMSFGEGIDWGIYKEQKETQDMRSMNYTGGEDWSKYKTQQETPDMRSMSFGEGIDWGIYKEQKETPDMRYMDFSEGLDWSIFKTQQETPDMRSMDYIGGEDWSKYKDQKETQNMRSMSNTSGEDLLKYKDQLRLSNDDFNSKINGTIINNINITDFPGDPKTLIPAILSELNRMPAYCSKSFREAFGA